MIRGIHYFNTELKKRKLMSSQGAALNFLMEMRENSDYLIFKILMRFVTTAHSTDFEVELDISVGIYISRIYKNKKRSKYPAHTIL